MSIKCRICRMPTAPRDSGDSYPNHSALTLLTPRRATLNGAHPKLTRMTPTRLLAAHMPHTIQSSEV